MQSNCLKILTVSPGDQVKVTANTFYTSCISREYKRSTADIETTDRHTLTQLII